MKTEIFTIDYEDVEDALVTWLIGNGLIDGARASKIMLVDLDLPLNDNGKVDIEITTKEPSDGW